MTTNLPMPPDPFLQEADDLLVKIEETVLGIRAQDIGKEEVNLLFRAFHTIKGSGAMFGFDVVAAFTHHVESVLDKVRDGSVPVSETLVNLILSSKDWIRELIELRQADAPVPPERGEKIIAALGDLLSRHAGSSQKATPALVAEPAAAVPAEHSVIRIQNFRIHFRPNPDIIACGTNPILMLDEIRAMGTCTVTADFGKVPALDQLKPDQCALAWDITLETDHELNEIKGVFIFVEEGSEISIKTITASDMQPASLPSFIKEQAPSQIVPIEKSSLPQGALEKPAASVLPTAEPARKATPKDSTIRVPSERLDRLVTLVGEMVMNQSRLSQVSAAMEMPSLTAPVEELERLVAELRDNVLGIRMMPIGTSFSRYKRLVHDLSGELGKEIDLITQGAETELDKSVLDQLGDPLVHLIRNSIDHGVESTEDRIRSGKPARGIIRLSAAQTGAQVVVTVQDDGRGLNKEAIRTKAVEKGLIPADKELSDADLYNLIFLPGFSTAKSVTNLSGRGVGMDVVKRQIDVLRGSIEVTSLPGAGTTIALTLPLTLAIIDGLLVKVNEEQFILPMSSVRENVELAASQRGTSNGRNLLTVRGELVPYLRLRDIFTITGAEQELERVVIVGVGGNRLGLVVDQVVGSRQTVIQSLGRFYQNIEVFSGATIMGDGRVALILDISGLLHYSDHTLL